MQWTFRQSSQVIQQYRRESAQSAKMQRTFVRVASHMIRPPSLTSDEKVGQTDVDHAD
jgi:hypothetical protein